MTHVSCDDRRAGWSLVTVVLAFVAALAAFGGSTAAAVATGPDIQQPFAADSGDPCHRGSTAGFLVWLGTPGELGVVHVTGTVSDEPDISACARDSRYTIAYFTAYVKDTEVDAQQRKADDGTEKFAFDLTTTATAAGAPITLVTVRVCRAPLFGLGPIVCGDLQKYPRP